MENGQINVIFFHSRWLSSVWAQRTTSKDILLLWFPSFLSYVSITDEIQCNYYPVHLLVDIRIRAETCRWTGSWLHIMLRDLLTQKCAQKKVTDFGYPRARACGFRKHQIENRFPELALPTFFKTWCNIYFLTTHERTFQPSLRGVEKEWVSGQKN
jgi:hypothetical protein